MLIFLGLVISLPLFGYVLFPLFDPAFKSRRRAEERLRALHLERDRYYEAIADLDFEYECGKLSEEDYRSLRERLMGELSVVLKRLDEAEGGNR
jgi:hypothetical protein